ncbi:hypothetical protein GJ744_006816 [Endocarpon pusillum]|uniref:DUF614 domain protein n=1 Tax=Endocarpon pusillum TaxID=364733 RepID=A0A8H7ASG1_9EURO|nr:hypothetical protein GJ744_006816 [Endocarpon pusillum]
MHTVLSQYNRPGSDVPGFPITPQSVPETSASYSSNEKPDFRTYVEHPVDSTQYANNIPQADAQYPGQEEAETEAATTSPGYPPVKSRMDLHKERETMHIAPDENPLSPVSPSSTKNLQNDDMGFDSVINNHLPGQAIHATQHIKGGTWKYGLCDCGDIGVCCTGAWCPCIVYGKTQYRLSQRSERKDPTNLLGYSAFSGSCAAFALLCGCNLILAAIQHSRVRKAYDIPGDVGSDFVRACCCCCCTLSQDEKEVKFRENQVRKVSGSTRSMQYTSPQGMTFSTIT